MKLAWYPAPVWFCIVTIIRLFIPISQVQYYWSSYIGTSLFVYNVYTRGISVFGKVNLSNNITNFIININPKSFKIVLCVWKINIIFLMWIKYKYCFFTLNSFCISITFNNTINAYFSDFRYPDIKWNTKKQIEKRIFLIEKPVSI